MTINYVLFFSKASLIGDLVNVASQQLPHVPKVFFFLIRCIDGDLVYSMVGPCHFIFLDSTHTALQRCAEFSCSMEKKNQNSY